MELDGSTTGSGSEEEALRDRKIKQAVFAMLIKGPDKTEKTDKIEAEARLSMGAVLQKVPKKRAFHQAAKKIKKFPPNKTYNRFAGLLGV